MHSIQTASPLRPPPGPDRAAPADGLPARWRRLALAGVAQLAGAAVAAAAARVASQTLSLSLPLSTVALGAGAAAAACGALLGLPRWWRAIHFAAPFAVLGALALGPDPAWFLAAFAACCLVFGASAGGAAPLYLSSAREVAALAGIIPPGAAARVLDAGCGAGTVLAGLRLRLSGARLEGVESSVLPWLVARLRAAACGGGFGVKWGSLWRADFGRYDVVYAFLSPPPMARLWEKARREMRPGSLLVSNRFAVPGVPPCHTVATGRSGRCLYVWRM